MTILISEKELRQQIREALQKEGLFSNKRRSDKGEGYVTTLGKNKELSGKAANFGPSLSAESSAFERATRLGKELGIDPAWIYAEEKRESGHNPKAMAWNLHIAVNDEWATKAGVKPMSKEQKEKFKKVGLPVGQKKSYYGNDALIAYQKAFEISPAHAIIGGAWGLYQVLGAFSLPEYGSDPDKWLSAFESNPVEHSKKALKAWIEVYGQTFKNAVNSGDYGYTTSKYYGERNSDYEKAIAAGVEEFRKGQDKASG